MEDLLGIWCIEADYCTYINSWTVFVKTASSTWNVLFTHTDCSPSPPPLIPLSPNMGTTIFPEGVCNILLSVSMSPSRLCFGCLAWVEGGGVKKGIIFYLLSTWIGGINGAWFFSCDWYQFFFSSGEGHVFELQMGATPPASSPPCPCVIDPRHCVAANGQSKT